ncbi:hypothetical protein BGZ83_002604 [Gryganskiella cystojenkinii]|nr:hypothetical protein BGZ83_002604 [Gryganskiella cystojenkinii]
MSNQGKSAGHIYSHWPSKKATNTDTTIVLIENLDRMLFCDKMLTPTTQEEIDQAHAAVVLAAQSASTDSSSDQQIVHHHHSQDDEIDLQHVLDSNDEAVQALIKAATAQYVSAAVADGEDPAFMVANVIEQVKKAAQGEALERQQQQQQQQAQEDQHHLHQHHHHHHHTPTSEDTTTVPTSTGTSDPSTTTHADIAELVAAAAAANSTTVEDLEAVLSGTHDPQELLQSLIPAAVAAAMQQQQEQEQAQQQQQQSVPSSPLPTTPAASSSQIESNQQKTSPARTKKSKNVSSSSSTSSASASSSTASGTGSALTLTSTPEETKPYVSTKVYNKDDIFCLGCCRNLSIDHYKDAKTDRLFKSCNACRQKSRINSKKVVKPATIPVQPTISMEEFGEKLRQLEDDEDESVLDVMVRLEGSTEMDPESLKTRGALIAQQVYESTGYWFSHSRTNDETQSKTRLKIYGCSQREDRRAPPAPKTQSRKRNRPSTKVYFPCKGNLTMTFYHQLHQVRVVYNHRRHAKYDNRKCPDHVRQFVKDNLSQPPRVLYENLMAANPSLGITQAQVRYWSHHYKKNGDQEPMDEDTEEVGASSRKASRSASVHSPAAAASAGAPSTSMDVDMPSRDRTPTAVTTETPSLSTELTEQEALEQLQRVQNEHVQELLHASNVAALQSLAAQHASALSSALSAVSVPIPSTDMDTSASHSSLTSSIVQSVLADDGKGLLELQARLVQAAGSGDYAALHSIATQEINRQMEHQQEQQSPHHHHHHQERHHQNEEDIVVQQVSAFMKENDRHLLALQQQQEQHELEQQQIEQAAAVVAAAAAQPDVVQQPEEQLHQESMDDQQ